MLKLRRRTRRSAREDHRTPGYGHRALKPTFLAVGLTLLLIPAVASGEPQEETSTTASSSWVEPTLVESKKDVIDITLNVDYADLTVGTQSVHLRTYNQAIVGPTLRFKASSQPKVLKVRLENKLPNPNSLPCPSPEELICESGNPPANWNHDCNGSGRSSSGHDDGDGGDEDDGDDQAPASHAPDPESFNITNLHTHGLHVSPRGYSDNVLLSIPPQCGFPFTVNIPADHPGGTFWYHPHQHGSTAIQVASGMSGLLIIEGAIDAVPEVAAAQERLFVFQQIAYDDEGKIESFDDVFSDFRRQTTINGQVTPTLHMRPGEVQRWRMLHAGVQELLDMELDGHKFHVIAEDGLALGQMTETQVAGLAPGNRIDVLVRASTTPGTYTLRKQAVESGIFGPEDAQDLAIIEVSGEPMTMGLPTTLPAPFPPIETTDKQRDLTFDFIAPSNPYSYPTFQIDNKVFDGNRIDQCIKLGEAEEWRIFNNTDQGHPFHIHVNPFAITAVNQNSVDPPVWQDTIWVPPRQSVTFRSRFDVFDGKFVLHCHILSHEDLGMMQLVEITPGGDCASE